MSNISLSYSKKSMFEECPRKYKYRYILRVEPEYTPDYFTLGSTVHDALASAERDGVDAIKAYERLLKEADLSLERGYEGRSMVENWIRWRQKRPKNEMVIFIEKPFEIYTSDGIQFIGKIDRVTYNEKKKVLDIIDYKTGKTKVPKDKVKNDLQLNAYALTLKTWYGQGVRLRASFLYLKDMDRRGGLISPETIKRAELDICQTYQKIIKATDFPKNPGWQCRFCQYKNRCESEV